MRTSANRWLVAVVVLAGAVACAEGAAPFVESRQPKLWTGTIEVPKDKIDGFTISPDGRTVFTTGDKNLSVWDLRTGKLVRGRPLKNGEPSPSEKVFVRGGEQIACAYGGDLYVLDLRSHEFKLARKSGAPYWVGDLAASPDGVLVAGARERAFAMWDVAGGKALWEKVLDKKEGEVMLWSPAFSPDGKVLAVAINHFSEARRQEVARLYDAATGRELRRLSCEVRSMSSGRYLAFSRDGRWLAMAFRDVPAVHVWDTHKWELTRHVQWEFSDIRSGVSGLGVSPDGKTLFVDGTDGVRLYETATWGLRRVVGCRISDFRLCPGDRYVGIDRGAGRVHVGLWREPAKPGQRTREELARIIRT